MATAAGVGDSETSHDRPKVFLSYSRKDLATAERLRDRLIAAGFEAYLDKHDILPGEPWQERLARLIETADTVAFLLSPDSVASPVVDWEVNEAERLAKRILPVVIRDADPEKVPGRLKRLNYVFIRNAFEEATGLAQLGTWLLTDIGWIREHTRLGVLAADWERGERSDALLLRGPPLAAAERWVSERPREAPEPTQLQRSFILAGRIGEQARIAREQAQIARTRRAQRRTAVVLALMLAGVVGGVGACTSSGGA